MAEPTLRDSRILVVEDEYMLAEELRFELGEAGADVLGPVGTVAQAMALIAREQGIDGAVLDANLGGEKVYPVADLLLRRGTAFVFTTGYDVATIPSRFEHVAWFEKPVVMAKLTRALGRIAGV